MIPLTQWLCDVCGDYITDPELGLVSWSNTGAADGYRAKEFVVSHKSSDGYACDPGSQAGFTSSNAISDLTGADGAARLLALLSAGPLIGSGHSRIADLDAFTDVFRRMQTPWYEEARPHFSDESTSEHLSDANEILPYVPLTLQRIAENTLG